MTDDPTELVRVGYDRLGDAYRADDAADAHYAEWLEELAGHLPTGGSVLDLGCGCGIPVARWLVTRGYPVTGIDLSSAQIDRARRLVPGAVFMEADMTTLDLPDQGFDAVAMFYSIIHVPSEDQPALLGRLHRWLLPGGWLIATVGHRAWTGTEEDWLRPGVRMYWSHGSRETYLRWFREAGFRIELDRLVPEGDGGHTLILAQKR
jgi:ubiquinone/menaquinone biosynthesis C-methylase UbiE